MEPPPLPHQKSKSNLYQRAATAGLVAALLAIAVSGVAYSVLQAAGADRAVILIMAGITFLVLLTGFVCALTALFGTRSHGTAKLLGYGLAGLIINGLLLLVFTTNFINARNKAIANRKGHQEITAAMGSFSTNVAIAFNPTNGLDAGTMSKQFSEYSAKLNEASRNMNGNDAIAAQALADCVAKWNETQKELMKSFDEFDPAALMRFKTLSEKEQIEGRRQSLTNFLKVNEDLRSFLLSQTSDLEAELRSRPIPPAERDAMMTGFREARVPIEAKVMEIRDCDKESGEAILKLLDLAESQWGLWHFDQNNKLVFTDGTAAKEFTALHAQIASLGKKEIQLQEQLIELSKQGTAHAN